MVQDPYLNDFNSVKRKESDDDMWHDMYTYVDASVKTYFYGINGAAWVSNVTVGSNLWNLDMCWNGNPPTPRNANQRWWFPTTTITDGDKTMVLDISCVTKKRIQAPFNTRLDVYITKSDKNIPFPSDPNNNAFLEYEATSGSTGLCLPASTLDTPNGPICSCY